MKRFVYHKGGGITLEDGEYVTRTVNGKQIVFFRDIHGQEHKEDRCKERLRDFDNRTLSNEAKMCREVLKDDARFRAAKDPSISGLKEYLCLLDGMTNKEILKEYFRVDEL